MKIEVWQGDITTLAVDAIVNAANGHLTHGGGVAGAIVRRGGQVIQDESDAIINERGPLATGEAVITSAGELPAQFVIHAVGPVWSGTDPEGEDRLLESAIRSALDLAAAHGVVRVSLPAISSGIFGFPKDRCARIFTQTIETWVTTSVPASTASALEEIRLCNIDDETCEIFQSVAHAAWGHVGRAEASSGA